MTTSTGRGGSAPERDVLAFTVPGMHDFVLQLGKVDVTMRGRGRCRPSTPTSGIVQPVPDAASELAGTFPLACDVPNQPYNMQDTQPSTSVPSSAIWRRRM